MSGCATPPPVAPLPAPPLRFLLSFDDGPSIRPANNPTEEVLETLARNPVQPGIKALFFVQTRALNGGGTPSGRALLQRELAEGHLLGFHTATAGHTSHLRMAPELLARSLQMGLDDHLEIAGVLPRLVRPPGWAYDARTLAQYQGAGLQMLLTDISATDGKIVWPNFSLRRRSHLLHQMGLVRERIARGEIPVVDGVLPVVVTFHDPNPFTASHLGEYLEILLEAAAAQGLGVDSEPFYGARAAIEQAALARAVHQAEPPVHVAGFWSSWRATLQDPLGLALGRGVRPPALTGERSVTQAP